MMRKWIVAGAGFLLMTLLASAGVPAAWAAPQAPAGPQEKPTYSMAEYNAYQAAVNEQNPAQRVKLLDDFVAKYRASTLMPYILRAYFLTYYALKNYPKTVEYCDKYLDLGDKLETFARLEALTARAQAFYLGVNQPPLNTPEGMSKARSTAADGLKVLGDWKKPDTMTDDQYAAQKKSLTILFNSIAGQTSMGLKDYNSAVDSYKAVLATDPTDATTTYRLGAVYLQENPPQYMDGFWSLARSIALKVPSEAQIRDYLRKQMLRYQQTGCDRLLDQQMNELLALAAGTGDRPASYKIPSAADLQKAREETTNFIVDLKAGGDKAKLLWLATCGLEFPEVGGKVIETSSANDSVVLKLFSAPTPEEIEAGKVPNMEVKVEGQPDAKRIEKDQGVRFSGTLADYTPDPFLLRWEKAKVNPEDIPGEKTAPAKKAPTKRPPKKPPSR